MALTIGDELKDALFELGDALGKPAATALVEMLDDMLPTIKLNAQMIQAARRNDRDTIKQTLTQMLGESYAAMAVATLPENKPEKKKAGRPRKNQGENNGND
jgi:hypothetical protein